MRPERDEGAALPGELEFYVAYTREHLVGLTADEVLVVADYLTGVRQSKAGLLALRDRSALDRLEPVLLAPGWSYPDFDTWRERFRELGAYPRSWRGITFAPAEPDEAATEALTRWRRLSVRARAILACRPPSMTADEFRRQAMVDADAFDALAAEFEREGFARRFRVASDRLSLLTVDELRTAARGAGVRSLPPRRDGMLAALALVPHDRLHPHMPTRIRDVDGLTAPSFPGAALPWIDGQRSRIRLFDETATAAYFRRWRAAGVPTIDAALIPRAEYEIHADQVDACPVCAAHAGERFTEARSTATELPPFHPGCTCRVERVEPKPDPRRGERGGL